MTADRPPLQRAAGPSFRSLPLADGRRAARECRGWPAVIPHPRDPGGFPGDSVPELPDIVVYLEALERRVGGQPLESIRLASPFLLRSVDPPLREASGRRVEGLRRLGKRLVFSLEGDLFLV